jgi:hypothetical protein
MLGAYNAGRRSPSRKKPSSQPVAAAKELVVTGTGARGVKRPHHVSRGQRVDASKLRKANADAGGRPERRGGGGATPGELETHHGEC